MKTYLLPYTVVAAGVLSVLGGCKEDPPPSLYQQLPSTGPTITSVAPPSGNALAGVTLVTLTGTGFSPTPESNFVNFGIKLGTVVEASATQLRVRAPLYLERDTAVIDSVPIKVAVQGMELFSNAIPYRLDLAFISFGGLANAVEDPSGMTTDGQGNLYVSLLNNVGIGIGVKKITPANVRTDYSPQFSSSVNKWTGMKYGRDGAIYATSNRNAVFRIPPGGGNAAPWVSVAGAGLSFTYDLDFDPAGFIWTGGDNTALARIAPDRTVRAFPFTGEVRSLRVYNGYLYCATRNDSIWNIWRSRIVADTLQPRELYFNFSQHYPRALAYAITFANDGEMYVGTDSLAGSIVAVRPDRSHEKFYSGVLTGRCVAFAYGTGVYMYVSRSGDRDADKKVIRLNMQKPGAPYYGLP